MRHPDTRQRCHSRRGRISRNRCLPCPCDGGGSDHEAAGEVSFLALCDRMRTRLLAGLATILLCSAAPTPAAAQIMLVQGAPTADAQANQPGFQIPIDEGLTTSFSDFERHAKRGDWEKAFRALNEIPPAKRTGMLRGPDGMIVPASQRIWEGIATLPAEGREAFRVFYDAQARRLWASIDQANQPPGEALKVARRVYEEFFLTSVGDDAANYLGDAAFGRGEFREADRYWKAVLDHHPGSDLGEHRLQVKRALALAQLGRTASFDALVAAIERQHAGQTLTLGGEQLDPVSFLKSLRERSARADEKADSAGSNASQRPSGPLPEATQTAWRLQFLSDQGEKQLNDSVINNYYYRNGLETWVPPYATADGRVFCNWFGIVFAVDARTGKLLWRSGKFDTIHAKFSQLPHSGANLDQYAIVASGDTVVTLWINPDRLNYHQEPFRLIAYDAATGNERWNSEKLEPLKNESFVGGPLIAGGDVLVTSHGRNDAKLQLRSLKLADGAQNFALELGTAQQTTNRRGRQVMPLPVLHLDGQTLYVLTNNGALLCLDLPSRQLQWVLKYGSNASGNSNDGVFYSGEIDTATLLHSYGALKEHEGLLYAKEADGRVIHAIDPAGPKLLWSRAIAPEAVLVGVDADHLYVLSRELMAIDRASQRLVWARRLPIEGGGLSAIVGGETLYVCSTRGIYCLDRRDGRLEGIFRGEDLGTVGAWIDVVGEKLISITNTAITAYSVPARQAVSAPATDTGAGS
jgi:outer membrane protein assembly factor BamB